MKVAGAMFPLFWARSQLDSNIERWRSVKGLLAERDGKELFLTAASQPRIAFCQTARLSCVKRFPSSSSNTENIMSFRV